jgi:hypothetical protein
MAAPLNYRIRFSREAATQEVTGPSRLRCAPCINLLSPPPQKRLANGGEYDLPADLWMLIWMLCNEPRFFVYFSRVCRRWHFWYHIRGVGMARVKWPITAVSRGAGVLSAGEGVTGSFEEQRGGLLSGVSCVSYSRGAHYVSRHRWGLRDGVSFTKKYEDGTSAALEYIAGRPCGQRWVVAGVGGAARAMESYYYGNLEGPSVVFDPHGVPVCLQLFEMDKVVLSCIVCPHGYPMYVSWCENGKSYHEASNDTWVHPGLRRESIWLIEMRRQIHIYGTVKDSYCCPLHESALHVAPVLDSLVLARLQTRIPVGPAFQLLQSYYRSGAIEIDATHRGYYSGVNREFQVVTLGGDSVLPPLDAANFGQVDTQLRRQLCCTLPRDAHLQTLFAVSRRLSEQEQ